MHLCIVYNQTVAGCTVGLYLLSREHHHYAVKYIAEGNTHPRWSHACKYTCVRDWVARVGRPYVWQSQRCKKVTLRSVPSQLCTNVYKKTCSHQEGERLLRQFTTNYLLLRNLLTYWCPLLEHEFYF